MMPPGEWFKFYSYNYHLICVRTSTFETLHAYNCLRKCLKIITCFKKQKFTLNQFKLRPSNGLSYSWLTLRSLGIGFSSVDAPIGRTNGPLPQISHDFIIY